jgi:hypothetical protein
MRDLLAWNVSQDLPRIRIDNNGVRSARHKKAMVIRVGGHVVPAALSPDVEGPRDLPAGLSLHQTTCEKAKDKAEDKSAN